MVMLNANKARDDIREILQKQEYQVYYNHSKGVLATWWEKAKEWIASQLEKLFPSIKSGSGASSAILLSIMVLVILFLAVSAFILIRNTRRNRLMRRQKLLQSLKEGNWTYLRHLEEAEKQESLDNFTESTRHLFLAILLYYHKKEWLEARIWKTNWDYYAELKKISQQNADDFFELAHFFEDAAYGERKVSPEEYKQFQTKIRDLLGARGVESIR